MASERADAQRTRARIVEASRRLLEQAPTTPVGDIAAAAGVSRSTLYRHFPDRKALLAAARAHRPEAGGESSDHPLPPGRLGRERPVSLEGIHVFDVVAPPVLPEQLVAEAQRIADVPLALYVLDIDGSHLLRVAGPDRLPERIEAPLAIGPELDSAGLAELRAGLADRPGIQVVPLWLRGRATGVMLTLGRPRRPLEEIARQAAAAITLADRYTDTFARASGASRRAPRPRSSRACCRRGSPASPAARSPATSCRATRSPATGSTSSRTSTGSWITLADGLGPNTRAAASSAVALGALRASRRSGGTTHDALMLMHRTLREMPGPAAEMTAIAARWDPATLALDIVNCGHTTPLVIRAAGVERLELPGSRSGRPGQPATLRAHDSPGRPARHVLGRRDHERQGARGPRLRRRRRGRAAIRPRLRRRHRAQDPPRRARRVATSCRTTPPSSASPPSDLNRTRDGLYRFTVPGPVERSASPG